MREESIKMMLAIGSEAIEDQIKAISLVDICDSDSDIDIIADALNYDEGISMVIVNTVLSESKSLNLAAVSKAKGVKVIAILENYENKELIATFVGLGVKAFATFEELESIPQYIKQYPNEFDFSKLEKSKKRKKGRGKEKEKNIEKRKAIKITPERPEEKKSARITFPKPAMQEANAGIRENTLKKKEEILIPQTFIAPVKEIKGHIVGKISIGVFNVSSGAGATTTAVTMTEYFARQGYSVLCVELDGKNDLRLLDGKKCHGQYFIPDSSERNNLEYLARDQSHQIIIYDFGRLYDIDTEGALVRIIASENALREFLRCNYKIALTFSEPWHIGRLNYFISDAESEEFLYEIQEGRFEVLISGSEEAKKMKKLAPMGIHRRKDLASFIKQFEDLRM